MVTFNYRGTDDLPYLCPLHQTVDKQMIVRPVLVFVHGLNPLNDKNHARNTWTNGSRKFWPKDYLPHDIPNADILLFAYNSNAAINVSASGIKEHGCTLFQELEYTYREELRNNAVKFIFVCHSLGGLIAVVDSHGLVQAFKKSLPGPPKAHGPGGLRPNRVISTIESSGSQN
jgi:hypothetical protein